MKKILAGALAAGLIGFGGVAYAASDPPSPSTGPGPSAEAPGPGHADARPGRHACGERRAKVRGQVLDTAAKTIGISRGDLESALRRGSSIAEVAKEHGVDPAKVVDALVKEATARLDAAVEAGKISEERAATIESRLPGMMEKLVERKGHEPGAHRGRGMHQGPGANQGSGMHDGVRGSAAPAVQAT